jgi:hypothetical protein
LTPAGFRFTSDASAATSSSATIGTLAIVATQEPHRPPSRRMLLKQQCKRGLAEADSAHGDEPFVDRRAASAGPLSRAAALRRIPQASSSPTGSAVPFRPLVISEDSESPRGAVMKRELAARDLLYAYRCGAGGGAQERFDLLTRRWRRRVLRTPLAVAIAIAIAVPLVVGARVDHHYLSWILSLVLGALMTMYLWLRDSPPPHIEN